MRLWTLMLVLLGVTGLFLLGCPTQPIYDDDAADDDDDSASDDDDDDDAASGRDIATEPEELEFGEPCIGEPAAQPLIIKNVGDEPLNIANMLSGVVGLNFQPFTGFIAPGGGETVSFILNCQQAGALGGVVVIVSDDPDEGELPVPIHAACKECPE